MTTTFLILALGIVVGTGLRLRYLRLPLDWDHGIMLYQSYWYNRTGRFLLGWGEREPGEIEARGKRPNTDETDMIRNGLLSHTFIYLFIEKICKDRVWAHRLFDLACYLVITLLLFPLGALLFTPVSGAAGAALFFIFSSLPFYWVADENPEKYQLLFTVAGLLAIVLHGETQQAVFPLLAGVLFFIAMNFKQNVGFVIAAAFAWLLLRHDFAGLALALAGMGACYAAAFGYYYFVKNIAFPQIFGCFVISFGVFVYILGLKKTEQGTYVRTESPSLWKKIKPNLVQILKESSLIWAGAIAWLAMAGFSDPHAPGFQLVALLMLGTTAGWFAANKFFPYYYIPFLPLLSLATGDLAWRVLSPHGPASLPGALFLSAAAALAALGAWTTFRFFFKAAPFEQGAYMYSNTLYNFGCSEEIGKHIRQRTYDDDFIYVYNMNPEIYFFSQRRCPTKSIYLDVTHTSSLTENERRLEEQALQEKLRKARPAYIVINTGANVPINAFESFTGSRYFLEKEYTAGYFQGTSPVLLHMYKLRKTEEATMCVSRGEALFAQGSLDEAVKAFHEALGCDPLCLDALNNLGVLHHQQGDAQKAAQYFSQAFSVDPSNRDVLYNLLHMEIPDDVKIRMARLYLQLEPDDPEIRDILDGLTNSSGRGEPQRMGQG